MDSQRSTELITEYLNQMNSLLVQFLGAVLPKISGEWWGKTVIDKLSYAQSERARKNNITNLDRLDLAALLRIFDQDMFIVVQKDGGIYH
jgi:hypothetical protein